MTKSRRPDPRPDSDHPAPRGDEYEQVFDRSTEILDGQLPGILQEINEAASLLAEILGTPGPERRGLLESGVRFHSLQLCQLLEERSREAWFSDPARAVQLVDLAVAVAERLDDAHYGLPLAEDARASAWAHLGNASRVAADLHRAEEAHRRRPGVAGPRHPLYAAG